MEAKVYNLDGKERGVVTLPESIFGIKWNSALIKQVVDAMQANARTNVAHTKTRGEVRGGGKKPWKQKGTGRARHGSIRSPLWRGGGTTFGPRNEKIFARDINKKMRNKALVTALSRKFKDNEVLFLEELSWNEPKTKTAKNALLAMGEIPHFE